MLKLLGGTVKHEPSLNRGTLEEEILPLATNACRGSQKASSMDGMNQLWTKLPLLCGFAAIFGCMDRMLPLRDKKEVQGAIHADEGPARNQRIRREGLNRIESSLESGAIDKKEYDRRKAQILNEYWQRENTRRHRVAESIHGSSRDHPPSP